ncbi:hypothetical protein [Ramlibacter rhizophilus]|uniref:Glycosyltransferase RgtA/B/C/D-like domain-containing protein n=1 Tax=Ramlibacter rhizophilus TaxID=1781167 RepID=A0A4Z0BGJ0_9BURK|nr:hypothetical protein [Ramlibacter rhizophilus]TFY97900.1 hypothetical protein EZ242_15700 [Ramlibacter rhizophilus]
MNLESSPPRLLLACEPALVWLLGLFAFMAVPVALGGLGLSWDALNHHVYLGWIAQSPRFDRDLLAAASQSSQYPYLYWPMYRLATAGVSGVVAGGALASIASLAVPAVWMIARWCCPGRTWMDFLLRLSGVFLAFMGGVTLSLLDSTSNDFLAAIPLLWAFAVCTLLDGGPSDRRKVALSGLLAGIAVGFKLSNGPIALVMPVMWLIGTKAVPQAAARLSIGMLLSFIGGLIAYGWWGFQLWQQYGNPIYPLYHEWFSNLNRFAGIL